MYFNLYFSHQFKLTLLQEISEAAKFLTKGPKNAEQLDIIFKDITITDEGTRTPLIGLLGYTPKCRLSQVIKSRKSEVDPQGIDNEKLFEVRKRFVTKIKMVKSVHK